MFRIQTSINAVNRVIKRLVKTMVSDLKRGDHFIHNDKLLSVDTVTSVQKGRGCRSFLITARELPICGPNAPIPAVTTIKPSTKDHFDVLTVKDSPGTFLYRQGGQVVVMGADMDEVYLPATLFTDALLSLIESGEKVKVKRVESAGGEQERVIAAVTGNVIRCTVKQVAPQGSSVVAVTQSGGRVICPTIVREGDQINVDANSGAYLGRVL